MFVTLGSHEPKIDIDGPCPRPKKLFRYFYMLVKYTRQKLRIFLKIQRHSDTGVIYAFQAERNKE